MGNVIRLDRREPRVLPQTNEEWVAAIMRAGEAVVMCQMNGGEGFEEAEREFDELRAAMPDEVRRMLTNPPPVARVDWTKLLPKAFELLKQVLELKSSMRR